MLMCMQDGDTPLICASEWGHAGMVRLLLAAKAQVDAANHVSQYAGGAWGQVGDDGAMLAWCGCCWLPRHRWMRPTM